MIYQLYGTETKEHLPSLSNSSKETIPVGVINNNRIHDFILCHELQQKYS